jgi:rubrerythrin
MMLRNARSGERAPDRAIDRGRSLGQDPSFDDAASESHEEPAMPDLKGSKTHKNLKDAFAGESQANRRYLYFARQADIEGYPDVGGLFRDTAEAETGHAHGHLDFLKSAGDPATDKPIGSTDKNLRAAVAGETYEYTEMYPGMARAARDEKFDAIAEWFETLAKAEKSHAGRFQKALDGLEKL